MNRQDQCVIKFLEAVHVAGLPMPQFEREFMKGSRNFRFDFCWPERKLAIELQGQAHKPNGWHTNVTGYNRDIEKFGWAAVLGWRLIQITPKMIDRGEVVPLLQKEKDMSTAAIDWDALKERVPQDLIKSRNQGGNSLSYVPWYTVCDLLDERAPGWASEIREVGNVNGKIFVRVAITIGGVTRENVGYEEESMNGYGDPFSNAYAMAIRRAAALFGIARHLYDKGDAGRSGSSRQYPQAVIGQRQGNGEVTPRQNYSKPSSSTGDVTANQIGAIKAICLNKQIDVNQYGDLTTFTRAEASELITELQGI